MANIDGIIQVRPGRSLFVRSLVIGTKTEKDAKFNIICVHGTMGSHQHFEALWQPMSEALQKAGCPAIVWMFDSIGCGQTPAPETSTTSDFSDAEIEKDIAGLITSKVDNSKPIVFFGHSYGPQTILKVADSYS